MYLNHRDYGYIFQVTLDDLYNGKTRKLAIQRNEVVFVL